MILLVINYLARRKRSAFGFMFERACLPQISLDFSTAITNDVICNKVTNNDTIMTVVLSRHSSNKSDEIVLCACKTRTIEHRNWKYDPEE